MQAAAKFILFPVFSQLCEIVKNPPKAILLSILVAGVSLAALVLFAVKFARSLGKQ